MSERLYFHAPCFDGAVSAAIAGDVLQRLLGWERIELYPVNYDLRQRWLSEKLGERSAVVDFLYHPSAMLWADHHETTYLPGVSRTPVEGQIALYDRTALSCARVLYDQTLTKYADLRGKYRDWVGWSDKIDGARYDSVEEAMSGGSPALRISAALALDRDRSLSVWLAEHVQRHTIAEIAEAPTVRRDAGVFFDRVGRGLSCLRGAARMNKEGIVVFDVKSPDDAIVSRYAAFYLFRDARYSVGVVRWSRGAKITAMRNPWIEFDSAPLGVFCEDLGGGGHHRVGSVFYGATEVSRAGDALATLVRRIGAYHRGAQRAQVKT